MALFKISKGNSANLPAEMHDGYCYFTIDDGKFYIDYLDINDNNTLKRRPIAGVSVEYIEGTQTASTNAWTGVTRDNALYKGKIIAYKLPKAGTGTAATLNLTLSNGSTSGAKAIKRQGASSTTTHYPAGTVIFMAYDGTYWQVNADYDSNTNTFVTQSETTTTDWRKVLLHYTANAEGGAVPAEVTNKVYAAEGIEVQPSTGTLKATKFKGPLEGNADTATEFSSVANVTLTGDVSGSANSTKGWNVTTTLATTGVTAGSYGPSANATPDYGATFNVPYITVDAKGRITAASTKTVKIPASDNTDTKVKQTEKTDDAEYKILTTATTTPSSGTAAEAGYDTDITINPSTSTITAGAFEGDLRAFNIKPTLSKVYASTSYYATAANQQESTWYFMSIKPTSWYQPWRVRFKVHSFEPSYLNANSVTYCTVSGREQSFVYANWNERYDSAHYYTSIYPMKKAGFDAGYGHAIGISILYGYNYTNSAHYRTFEVDYFDCDGCTVELLNTPVKWGAATWLNNSSLTIGTYYNGVSNMDATSRGLQESGDANNYDRLQMTATYPINGSTLRFPPYTIFGYSRDGKAQSFSLYNAGYTSSTTSINTVRVYNTAGIDWTRGLHYYTGSSNFAVDANLNISTGTAWSAIDFRYSDNCVATTATTTLGLVARKPVYFRGTIGADGLFYIAPLSITYNNNTYQRAWTQDIPTTEDGYVYWFIGYPYYNSSYAGGYQIDLFENNPLYWYHHGQFEQYTSNGGVADAVAWDNVTDKPSTFTPSSHSHGNITNAGELSTATRAVVTDANKKITVADLTVSSATAETTTATTFVHSVTQDAQGKITVKTRPLPTYNNYSLPLAASGTRGGIQIGYTQSGQNYPVQLSSEKAYVNVPWTDTKVTQKIKSDNNDYRIILSYEANDTDNVTNTVNKASNLRYNPSLNKLSTGNIALTGTLAVTGAATFADNATVTGQLTLGSLLVNGNSSFVNDVSFTKIPTAPTAAAGTNNTQLATTAFVMNAFTANDAMVFKGVVNSASGLPATHYQGWTYKVGTAGSYVGTYCEIGDLIICVTDGTSADNAHWAVIQNNVDGAVFMGHGGSAIGGATQPVYVKSTGEVVAGTALKALAYKDSISYTPAGTIANTSITPAGTISSTSITPAGTNAKSAVTIKATTTDVYSMTSAGSKTDGTAASLTMSVTDEVLSFSWTPNVPTAVTLPGRSSVIKAWTGYTTGVDNTYAAAQVFTGTAASHDHTFTGTAASHNHTFTGTAATLS